MHVSNSDASYKDSFADPHHFNPDPDPTPHHSDANLRLLAYRTFTAQF
jgi:hypothetical protein